MALIPVQASGPLTAYTSDEMARNCSLLYDLARTENEVPVRIRWRNGPRAVWQNSEGFISIGSVGLQWRGQAGDECMEWPVPNVQYAAFEMVEKAVQDLRATAEQGLYHVANLAEGHLLRTSAELSDQATGHIEQATLSVMGQAQNQLLQASHAATSHANDAVTFVANSADSFLRQQFENCRAALDKERTAFEKEKEEHVRQRTHDMQALEGNRRQIEQEKARLLEMRGEDDQRANKERDLVKRFEALERREKALLEQKKIQEAEQEEKEKILQESVDRIARQELAAKLESFKSRLLTIGQPGASISAVGPTRKPSPKKYVPLEVFSQRGSKFAPGVNQLSSRKQQSSLRSTRLPENALANFTRSVQPEPIDVDEHDEEEEEQVESVSDKNDVGKASKQANTSWKLHDVSTWSDLIEERMGLQVLEGLLYRRLNMPSEPPPHRKLQLDAILVWASAMKEIDEWHTSTLADLGNLLVRMARETQAVAEGVDMKALKKELHEADNPDDTFAAARQKVQVIDPRNKRRGKGAKKRIPGTCWSCGQTGHKSPDCPTKQQRSGNEKGGAVNNRAKQ